MWCDGVNGGGGVCYEIGWCIVQGVESGVW